MTYLSSYKSGNLWHTEDGFHRKYPIKTCRMSDDLSGDMLVLSGPNLVKKCDFQSGKVTSYRDKEQYDLQMSFFTNSDKSDY